MPHRVILIVCLTLWPCALAQAQGPRVLALAPASPSPDWPSSLAVELAPFGGQVLRSPLATGPAAEDPNLAARVAAQVVGAEAAVWLDAERDRIHVVLAASRRAFDAPLSAEPDARTVALVAASLLEEAFATAVPSGTPLPSGTSPREQLDRPVQPVPQRTDPERAPVNRSFGPRRTRTELTAFGAIGTGGLAWMSDINFDPGTQLRGTLGVRVGSSFQLQATVDVGLVRERVGANDGGLELQPFGRVCPELVWVIPADAVLGFQVGGHGCIGVAELRYFSPFELPFDGFWNESPVVTAAGGGYLALELRPSPRVSVSFRADLDGTQAISTTDGQQIMRQPDVLASLSTMVGFW